MMHHQAFILFLNLLFVLQFGSSNDSDNPKNCCWACDGTLSMECPYDEACHCSTVTTYDKCFENCQNGGKMKGLSMMLLGILFLSLSTLQLV